MLEERVQQEFRQHEARRKTLMRRTAGLSEFGQDRPLREASESIRPAVEDGLGRLQAQRAEAQRERLLPTSVANNTFNNLVEDVTTDDLARDANGRMVHLGVAPELRDKVRRLVSELVRPALRSDLEVLNAGLEALGRDVAARLAAAGADDLRIAPPETLDESTVWEAIHKTIHLESRYRGELLIRGKLETTFDLAMHARKPLFLVMMTAPILFPFLPNPRVQLAPLMLPLLIGGGAWAVHSFRNEHQEKISGKRPASARRWARRSVDSTSKPCATRMSGRPAPARGRQEAHATGGGRVEGLAAEQAIRSARERTETQDRLKAVDNRLREVGGLIQQVGRVRQAASEARQALERATRDAIRSGSSQGSVVISHESRRSHCVYCSWDAGKDGRAVPGIRVR